MIVQKKNKKYLYVIGILFILYILGSGHSQQAVWGADDLEAKGYVYCSGENWVCCEDNTYWLDETSIYTFIRDTFTEVKFPKKCCTGLTKSKVENIKIDRNWFETLVSIADTSPSGILNFRAKLDNIIDYFTNLLSLGGGSSDTVDGYVCEDVPADIPGGDIIADWFGVTAKYAFYIMMGLGFLVLIAIL